MDLRFCVLSTGESLQHPCPQGTYDHSVGEILDCKVMVKDICVHKAPEENSRRNSQGEGVPSREQALETAG